MAQSASVGMLCESAKILDKTVRSRDARNNRDYLLWSPAGRAAKTGEMCQKAKPNTKYAILANDWAGRMSVAKPITPKTCGRVSTYQARHRIVTNDAKCVGSGWFLP